MFTLIGIIAVLFVVYFVMAIRKNKKPNRLQQRRKEILDRMRRSNDQAEDQDGNLKF